MRTFLVFFLKILEYFIGWLFRSSSSNKKSRRNFNSFSNIEKVKFLEKRRQLKGYRKQWLYYRCKEEGLLKEYNQLFKKDVDKLLSKSYKKDVRVKFSFGKYRGKPVEDVWYADRDYAKWVSRQEWINDYPEIEYTLETLHYETE